MYKAGDKNSWISANTSFYDLVTLRPGKMSGYSSTARVANTGYLWQEVLTSSDVLSRQHCVLRKTLGHLHLYMQRQKSNFGKTAKDLQACFWGGRSRVVSRCLWWQKLDVSDETSGYTDSESLAYSLSLRSGNKLYFSLQTSCFIKTGVETIRTWTWQKLLQELRWDSTSWFTSSNEPIDRYFLHLVTTSQENRPFVQLVVGELTVLYLPFWQTHAFVFFLTYTHTHATYSCLIDM